MLWLILSPAFAYELTEGEALVASGEILAMASGDLDGDGSNDLVLADPAGLDLLLSGGPTRIEGIVAHGLLIADLDGSGTSQLYTCGDAGISRVDWEDTLTEGLLLGSPCTATAAADLDGDGDLDLLTIGESVELWEGLGGGSFAALPLPGIVLVGAPALATDGESIWVGDQGATALWRLDGDGVTALEATAAVGGVIPTPDGPTWSEPAKKQLQAPVGLVSLSLSPGLLAAADLDGDAWPELALADTTGETLLLVGGLFNAPQILLTLPTGWSGSPTVLELVDLDGDSCPDLLFAEDLQLGIWYGSDCGTPISDVDGDGWSTEEGDCDDHDPTIHPDAEELCDGEDNDCDGSTDETSVRFDLEPAIPQEGDHLTLTAVAEGCADPPSLSVQIEEEAGECIVADSVADCYLVNQGALQAQAVSYLPDGGEEAGSATLDLEISNAPPRFDSPLNSQVLQIEEGMPESLSLTFLASDPGPLDQIHWSFEGGPPGTTWTEDGELELFGDPDHLGTWEVLVVVADEDGGVTEGSFEVRVEEARLSGGCCCFGATAGISLPAWLLLLRRRPRRAARTARSTPPGAGADDRAQQPEQGHPRGG